MTKEFDDRLGQLTTLVDELIALLTIENRELEMGMPSALSRSTSRKARLGAELDVWMRQIRGGELNISFGSPAVRIHLRERSEVLDEAIRENMVRLKAGIDATRCRVDAIMRAIREQMATEGNYDATGRRSRTPNPPSSMLA